MSQQPNIVLICVDQWRADCLSIENHPVVHTPFLDQLALEGARFNRAYSACPNCIAARAALFTGTGQKTHGRVGYQDGVEWDYPTNIAGEFTRHGYQTQAVGKMHVFPERSQMGFQNVVLHDGFLHYARKHNKHLDLIDDYTPWARQLTGREVDYAEHGLDCNSYVVRPWPMEEHLHPTNFVATQSIDFFPRRRDPSKPFFLYMSFVSPHPPLDPPAWALDQYINRTMPEPPLGEWVPQFAQHATPKHPSLTVGKLDPVLYQRARAGYYALMTHIDHQIYRVIEGLRQYGVRDNTYICFVSDHGEMMGDHNFFRKSLPFEGSARVPLILSGPADSGIRRGNAFNHVIELRDIMPTLLNCAGLPVPETVDGRNLLPLSRGEITPWRPYLHGEHTTLGQSIHWVTDGHDKFIWLSQSGREYLFNLDTDPNELKDLSHDRGVVDRLTRLRMALVKELTGREEEYTDGHRLIPGRQTRNVLSHILKDGAAPAPPTASTPPPSPTSSIFGRPRNAPDLAARTG